jgi:hypothetical protein
MTIMDVQELLKPRYKVIAEWPGGDYLQGDIFIMGADEDGTMLDKIHFVFEHTCKKYPHLFKPLQWWEERKESEMPEYVKLNTNHPKTYQVKKLSEFDDYIILRFWLPATKAEYLTYKQQSNG